MATSIARYLLDEASSGTSPTECADDQGSNTLTIDYSSGDANWVNITPGNGLDFTAASTTANSAIAELADISTNGDIGSSLDGVSGASCLFVIDLDNGNNNGARAFHIGTNTGNGDFGVTFDGTERLFVRWDYEDTSNNFHVYPAPSLTGAVVIAIVVDTTQAAEADRTKVYYDNVLKTRATGDTIAQNSTLDNVNSTNRSMCLGNRPSQNRNVDGALYYFELFTGQLTATEVEDAYDALILDNDADWAAGGASTLTADSGSYVYTGTAAELQRGLIMSADSGTYVYSGTDGALNAGFLLSADSGAYNYTGTNADLVRGLVLSAESGSYAYSGTDAGLFKGSVLVSESGSYVYTGTNATLTFEAPGDFTLTADSGSYVYAGTNAGLFADRLLSADSGSYVYTGTSADLIHNITLVADSGAYIYSGTTIGLVQNRVLAALSGAYVYSGTDVNFLAAGEIWTIQTDSVTIWASQADSSAAWSEKIDSTTTWTVQ
ncbi:MAG: hypothetical protein JKY81_04610 [Colwellia sp.]|nr:hypothetical protein [Colwellia sp.]